MERSEKKWDRDGQPIVTDDIEQRLSDFFSGKDNFWHLTKFINLGHCTPKFLLCLKGSRILF